jgi:hypothetical protein
MKKVLLVGLVGVVFAGCAHKAPVSHTKISGATVVVTQKMIDDVKNRRLKYEKSNH